MISHKHKFIFIFQHKCASSTLRLALEESDDFNLSFHQGVHSREYKNNDLDRYSDYLVFASCRNPYERIVSAWKYLQRDFDPMYKRSFPKDLSFKDTLLNLPELEQGVYDYKHITEKQVDTLLDSKGSIITDMLVRFENLQQDFDTVCDKIGISRQKLHHHNKTNHRHYTKYYDDESRAIVAEKFAKDIEYFGYEFGE